MTSVTKWDHLAEVESFQAERAAGPFVNAKTERSKLVLILHVFGAQALRPAPGSSPARWRRASLWGRRKSLRWVSPTLQERLALAPTQQLD